MKQANIYIIVSLIYALVIGYDIFNWFRYRNISAKEVKIKRLKSTINLFIAITGCVLVLLSTSFHINIFNYRTPVAYSNVDKLTLRDFRGFNLPGHTVDGEKKIAFIVTSIDYEIDYPDVTIQALFHPSRSYVYSEKLVDNSLLRHELYHFHITEYIARLIRKELAEHNLSSDKNEIRAIIESYLIIEQGMQQMYDAESYHSYVLSQQKKWENKIDSLLTLHQNYVTPTLSLK